MIEDDWFSLFPQVQSTERPDRVMAARGEGSDFSGWISLRTDRAGYVSDVFTVARGLL